MACCDFSIIGLSQKQCVGKRIFASECNDDISGPPSSMTQNDLILSRTRFGGHPALLIISSICETHREEFGKSWQKPEELANTQVIKGKGLYPATSPGNPPDPWKSPGVGVVN